MIRTHKYILTNKKKLQHLADRTRYDNNGLFSRLLSVVLVLLHEIAQK